MHTNRWKNIHAYLFEPEKRLQTSLCTWSRLVNPAHHITTHLSFWRTENKLQKHVRIDETTQQKGFFSQNFLGDHPSWSPTSKLFGLMCLLHIQYVMYRERVYVKATNFLAGTYCNVKQCSTDFHSNIQFLLQKVHLSPMIKINAIIME